jgi:hypothetical protein
LVVDEPYLYQIAYVSPVKTDLTDIPAVRFFESFFVGSPDPEGFFMSKDGHFAVTFPVGMGKIQQNIETVPTESGDIDMHIAMATGENNIAMVVWAEYPERSFEPDRVASVLDLARDAAMKNMNAKPVSTKETTVSNYPAESIQFKGTDPNGRDVFGRVDLVLARPYFYQILYGSDKKDVEQVGIRRLFDSFLVLQ